MSFFVSPPHSHLYCSCCPLFWRLNLLPCTKNNQVCRCFLQKKENTHPFPFLENFLCLFFLITLHNPKPFLYGCTSQSLCVVSIHIIQGFYPKPLWFSIADLASPLVFPLRTIWNTQRDDPDRGKVSYCLISAICMHIDHICACIDLNALMLRHNQTKQTHNKL